MTGKALSLGRFWVPGRDFVREQMRRGRVLAVLAGAVAVWGAAALAAAGAANGGAVPAVSGAVPAVCAWGRAIAVPGLGALSKGGQAQVNSVSCASAGNCAAGGHYADRHGQQGFVASERNGRWGRAIEVPGLGALNKAGGAEVVSVSCGSAGNCAAGGYYQDRYGQRGFVAVERHGRWRRAIEVPGLAALNTDRRNTQVLTVSCGSAGSCAAGGFYTSRSGHHQGFVTQTR